MAVVEKVAGRIAVMYLGELIEISTRDSVLQQHTHDYTKRLLDAVPASHPGRRRQRLLTEREIPSPIRPANHAPQRSKMEEFGSGHFLRRTTET